MGRAWSELTFAFSHHLLGIIYVPARFYPILYLSFTLGRPRNRVLMMISGGAALNSG
jgi:hypothetical protein